MSTWLETSSTMTNILLYAKIAGFARILSTNFYSLDRSDHEQARTAGEVLVITIPSYYYMYIKITVYCTCHHVNMFHIHTLFSSLP